jgi:hypothetical protein
MDRRRSKRLNNNEPAGAGSAGEYATNATKRVKEATSTVEVAAPASTAKGDTESIDDRLQRAREQVRQNIEKKESGGAAAAATNKRKAPPAWGRTQSESKVAVRTTETLAGKLKTLGKTMSELKKDLDQTEGGLVGHVAMITTNLIEALILATTVQSTDWDAITKAIFSTAMDMGVSTGTLVKTLWNSWGTGSKDFFLELGYFLTSGSWLSGIFLGIFVSVMTKNKAIFELIMKSYIEAAKTQGMNVQSTVDNMRKYISSKYEIYNKQSTMNIINHAITYLGRGSVAPLRRAVEAKIRSDKDVNEGLLKANIDSIKIAAKKAIVEDADLRGKGKAAAAAGFVSDEEAEQPSSAPFGGRRTKRRRRGKKSRKYSKKQSKRRRKHSMSTKRRKRRSKLGKRRTKRGGMCCGKKVD